MLYVWARGRKLRDIGFHTQFLGPSLLIGGLFVVGLFAVSDLVQLISIRASGEDARIAFSAVDPKTGMTGGMLFGLWLILANFVNSAMEEGLFRGLMLRHFRLPYSVWKAILLQALLFAIWHLNWPIQNLLAGKSSLGEAGFEAFGLLLSTGISGIVYGYMYHRTDNLWAPFLGHTINNTALNLLFIRTAAGFQSSVDFGLFLAIWLPGHLLLIPLIAWFGRQFKMPQVKPWGTFGSDQIAVNSVTTD